MQVTKIRIADENGLVPAGAYFERLAAYLGAANARRAGANERADQRERKLETQHRRAKAVRLHSG